MQHPTTLVLLGALCSAAADAAGAAGAVPRGVGPEYVSHYRDKEHFRCIDHPEIEIGISRVNDNTCDCPDGSDEPGTAACAHIDPLSPEQPLPGSSSGTTKAANSLPGFWCENKGHIGAYVPFIYVNDGFCDYDVCCDGSEEYAGVGGVKCENRCAEIGKEYRKLAEEKRLKIEKAAAQRAQMIGEAAVQRSKAEARLALLEKEVVSLQDKKADLEAKYTEAQRLDSNRVVRGGSGGGKLGVLVSQAKARVQELRDTLTTVADERDKLRIKINELESALRSLKEEYNPNFNDEGVKSAVKFFEDYAARESGADPSGKPDDVVNVLAEDGEHSGINWSEFEGVEDGDTDIIYSFDAYLPSFVRNFLHDKLAAARLWLVANGMLAESENNASESQATRAVREAKETAERDLENKNRDIENEKTDLATNYGPDEIFRALRGKCTSIEAGEYTYELCWLDKTSQKSKKGHGNTNMGNFKRIDREMADDEERLDGKSLGKGERMVLRYEDGQACWNGPNRKTDVWLGCAETEELWRVTEAEKCVYKMEVGTPAACEEKTEERPAKKQPVRDEL